MTGAEIRAAALREAVDFLLARRSNPRQSEPLRLADVADVAARMEAYMTSGTLPLEPDWRPAPPPPATREQEAWL